MSETTLKPGETFTATPGISAAPAGQRKARATLQASLILLAGLALAAFAKCPPELYFAFAIGVTGNSSVFMWGNSKEHQATNGGANK